MVVDCAEGVDAVAAEQTRTGVEAAAEDVAALLVKIRAVEVRPNNLFTFASGLLSPIYCDNRLFLSHPAERTAMLDQLYRAIDQQLGSAWDGVAGVATAGIPFAAWVAMHFDKPMVYIRSSEKDHGKQHRIEGGLDANTRVILIEDLITTGGSAVAAVSVLRDAGFQCDHCFSIFDYQFAAAARAFADQKVAHRSLTGVHELVQHLRQENALSDGDVQQVETWHAKVNADGEAAR
jgi:orotate phosphoribosyltransferase